MFNRRKIRVATAALAACFGIVGSSAAMTGCVLDEVPAGAHVGNDGLGGTGGATLSSRGIGVGGLPPYVEAPQGQAEAEAGLSAMSQSATGDAGVTAPPALPADRTLAAQAESER